MRRALLLGLLLALPSIARAYTCEGNTCTLYLTIIEGTGANLKDHVFTYQKVGGPVQTLTIPLSKPQGGGTVTVKTAPQTVLPCTTATFTGSLVTRSTTGTTSPPDVAASPTIDRTKLANGQPDPKCKR
jgi:hypothetical protein